MLNDLFRTYKKIIILVLILLCGIIFWFYGCHRQQNSKEAAQIWEKTEFSDSGGHGYHFQTTLFSGDVVFGTEGYLAEDKTMPVTMTITSLKGSFNGTLRITLPGDDGKGVSYQSAVNCRKSVTSKVTMEVPELGNVSYFYFEILDSFGTLKFSEEVRTHEEMKARTEDFSGEEFYLGVLSSQYKALEYLDGMTLEMDGQTIRLKLVRFLAGTFPADVRELGALSGILADAFDLSSLTKDQLNCLENWVAEGGNLFMGTGTGAEVVLSSVEKTLGVHPGKVSETPYDFNDELSRAGSVKLYSSHLKFDDPDQWEALAFSSPDSAYVKEYASGSVTVLSFSLTDDTFLQWTGRDKVIRLLFREKVNADAGYVRTENTSLWYIKKALYAFMNARHPNTFYYGLFFIVYLGLLGFFAYYLLRKMKKREYIWGVVPLIAIVFTVSLAFRTDGGSNKSGRSFSALRISDSAAGQDDYYFLYQNNEGEEGSVDLLPSITSVKPVDYAYQNMLAENSATQNVTPNYTVNNTKNGFDIVFGETVPGTSYILKCSSDSGDQKNTDCFTADIQAGYSFFEGTVKNVSSLNFEKVILIRGRQYVIFDGVASGETVRAEKHKVQFWSGYGEETPSMSEENEAGPVGSLVEYLQQRYIMSNEDQNTLLAVGITDENDFQLFSGGDAPEKRLTMYINRFDLQAPDGEDCVIDINNSCLGEESWDSPLQYDMLEKNETKAVYTFDTSKLVWGMFRNRDGFEGTIYAYNYHTKEQDIIFSREDEYMNCGALEPYISDMNKMILTFCLPEGTSYGGAPVLSLLTKDIDRQT